MKRLENIEKKEAEQKKKLFEKQMSRKLCYYFIFSNQIAFRDFWVPKMKKGIYKLRFYQYAPALCDNLAWGGARTVGKSDDCVFSILFKALREKRKETLLTAFRKIHVRERLEDLIGSVLNSPYLRKFFKGDADRSLRDAVLRSPIYSIRFKNGHEIKGVSTGDDPSAVMIQSFHPHNRFIDETQTYPEASWVKFQSTQAPEGSVDRYYGVQDGRVNSPFYLILNKLSKFKGKRFFIPRMMEPWFDQKKKEDYIQSFGSEESNDYRQQVLAQPGEPSWSLWSQRDILKNIDMTEIRTGVLANALTTIRISQADLLQGLQEKIGDSNDPKLIQATLYQIFEELLFNLPSLPSQNLEVIFGIDAGWTSPTVILPFFFYNNKWNLRCKILLTDKMIPDYQASIIDYIATKYNALIGIDFSDGEGKALATSLANPAREEFAGKNYQERVIWIEFQRNMLTGYKPDGSEVTEKIKDKTTKLLQSWFSEGLFNIYYDEDFFLDFNKETLKKTATGTLIHTPQDVHIPEAMRVFAFVWLEKHGKIDIPQEQEEEFEDYGMLLPERGNLDFGLFGRPGEKPAEGL